VIKGDLLHEYKSFKIIVQATPRGEGSFSLMHWSILYEMLKKDTLEPSALFQFVIDVSKHIDAYLN
jgi:hypothetical protein